MVHQILSDESLSENLADGKVSEKSEIPSEYQALLEKYQKLLKTEFTATSKGKKVIHYIDTGHHKPCSAKLRPLMEGSPKEVKGKEAFMELVDFGIVEPVDISKPTLWTSALHLQPKPSGGLRPCGDFRGLNSKTQMDKYPLPHLQKFTHKLHDSKIFTKLDIKKAYHHVEIAEQDRHKTAVLTPWGCYQFKKMAMGLANASQSYQRYMDSVLQGVENAYCYLDDVLIFGNNPADHYKTVEEVFRRLSEAGLSLALDKCQFAVSSLEFLGYQVDKNGITPLPKKVSAINKFPEPTKQKELLGFLGSLNYFRHCLGKLTRPGEAAKSAAEILAPLYQIATCVMPKPSHFPQVWKENPILQKAFREAKELLMQATTLAHPNPSYSLALTCDASKIGIGGFLEQYNPHSKLWEPLGFFSRRLPADKQRWSTFKRELYSVHQAMRHFHQDFVGRHLVVWTDHRPLVDSFLNPDLQKNDPVALSQMAEIGQFTHDIRFIEGKSNICADMLSRPFNIPLGEAYRMPEQIATVGQVAVGKNSSPSDRIESGKISLTTPSVDEVSLETLSAESIEMEQKTCDDVRNHRLGKRPKDVVMEDVKYALGPTIYCEVSIPNKPRPLLPKKLRLKILEAFHHIDHCGNKELARRAADEYYWPAMGTDAADFCRKCHACNVAKTGKPIKTPLTKIGVPDKRFSYLNLDIVGPLPESRGYKYIFTILDRTSRLFQAVPLVKADAESCCKAFLNHWVALFSLPAKAVSDNGNTFVSNLWKGLQESLGVKVEFTPRFRPQANGAVERQHQSLKNSLKAALVHMGDVHREKWADALPWVLLGRRAAYQKDLGCSPYQLTFGQAAVLPGSLVDDPGPPLRKEELKSLLHHLESRADRPAVPMSNHAVDAKIYTKDIDKASHCYLRLDNPQSLQPRYHGPFLINKRIGDSTIEVKTGTYRDGSDRLELHSWHNAKPAFVDDESKVAERPKLGRPSKHPVVESPSAPLPSQSEASEPDNRQRAKTVSKSKQSVIPAESTHPMKLRNKS